jgi:diketogulonate reductase-like aldo/keto reductase
VGSGTTGAPASKSTQLSAAKATLEKMQKALKAGTSEYGQQMRLIAAIVAALEHGDKRLESAYIYGNVEAFLPSFTEK